MFIYYVYLCIEFIQHSTAHFLPSCGATFSSGGTALASEICANVGRKVS